MDRNLFFWTGYAACSEKSLQAHVTHPHLLRGASEFMCLQPLCWVHCKPQELLKIMNSPGHTRVGGERQSRHYKQPEQGHRASRFSASQRACLSVFPVTSSWHEGFYLPLEMSLKKPSPIQLSVQLFLDSTYSFLLTIWQYLNKFKGNEYNENTVVNSFRILH